MIKTNGITNQGALLSHRQTRREIDGQTFVKRPSNSVLHHGLVLVLVIALLAGCATLPTDYDRTESRAFQNYASTSIGKQLVGMEAEHPGASGFAIIRYPRPAFTSRIMLTELAEKSLDLQYYIWESDTLIEKMICRVKDKFFLDS